MKSLNELKMLQLIFDDHFTELGYEKLNSNTFDLKKVALNFSQI